MRMKQQLIALTNAREELMQRLKVWFLDSLLRFEGDAPSHRFACDMFGKWPKLQI